MAGIARRWVCRPYLLAFPAQCACYAAAFSIERIPGIGYVGIPFLILQAGSVFFFAGSSVMWWFDRPERPARRYLEATSLLLALLLPVLLLGMILDEWSEF